MGCVIAIDCKYHYLKTSGEPNMITITMSKNKDINKLLWCSEVLGADRYSFQEPMQLTFKNKLDRFLYQIAWGE